MRESKAYRCACAEPKETKSRQELFNKVQASYKFKEYDLHSYVKILCQGTWLREHIDSATAQKLGSWAFSAVKYYSVGKHGRPRFQSKTRFLV